MICECGKCGKIKEIVCLVDGVPYCNECFLIAMGADEEGEDD